MLSQLHHLATGSAGCWGIPGGGGAWAGRVHIIHEQIILNLLSSVTYTETYNSMSKGQILQYLTYTWSYIHMTILTTYSLSPPYLGGGVGKSLRWPCLSPSFAWGGSVGWGWLGPPLSFVLANARVGRGQGTALTNDNSHLSYVLSFMFSGPFIPTFNPYPTQTVVAFDCALSPPPFQVLLRPDGLLVLLLMEVLEGWDHLEREWQLFIQKYLLPLSPFTWQSLWKWQQVLQQYLLPTSLLTYMLSPILYAK